MKGFEVNLPNDEPFWIAPLGDIQWNGHEEDIAFGDLQRHLTETLALPGHVYFIGMGDYIDYAAPSSRSKIVASEPYDNTMRVLDDASDSLVEEVYTKILKPTTGKWAGLLSGHHLWKYQSGMLSDHKLAERLQCSHMGMDMEGAIIQFNIPTQKGSRRHIDVWAHHGVGAGEESTLLLRMKKLAADYEEVDIFLHGHVTKMASTVIPKLRPVFAVREGITDFRLVERRVALVGTGGWQKAYGAGSTYVERKLMRPVSLGAPLIQVIPSFNRQYGQIAGKTTDNLRWQPRFKLILQ